MSRAKGSTALQEQIASLLPQNSNNGNLFKPAAKALGSVGNYASILSNIGDVTSNLMQIGNNEEGMTEAQLDSKNKKIAGSTTSSIIGIALAVLSICLA